MGRQQGGTVSDAHRLAHTLLRDERALSEAPRFDADTTSNLRVHDDVVDLAVAGRWTDGLLSS
jgi:hypothetical protein